MNTDTVVDILNDLLSSEARSVLPRLGESQLFTSWASAEEARVIRQMIEEDVQHGGRLVETITRLGRDPLPAVADIRSADIHFLEWRFVLPRVLEDRKQLLAAYESATSQVATNDAARETVNGIAERLRRHVERLEMLNAESAST